MNKEVLEVLESWNVSGHGIILQLRHTNNKGLLPGMRLVSKKTGMSWIVKSRLIFSHTEKEQIRLPGENESFMHLKFAGLDKLEISKAEILEKEKQGIFQYQLDHEEHNQKPLNGEEVYIEQV